MPYSLKFDDALGCCFTKWSVGGAELLADVRAFYREVGEHPRLRSARIWFHDVREVDLKVPTDEVRALTSLLGTGGAHQGQERRLAFLVSSSINFGIVRIFQALGDRPGIKVHVTQELVEAKKWLGLPATTDDPFD